MTVETDQSQHPQIRRLKLLMRIAARYPFWIAATILLGFSGALFNGVGTVLLVPILLEFVGQGVRELQGFPPVIKTILSTFDSVPDNYRTGVMMTVVVSAIVLKNIAGYTGSLTSAFLTRFLTTGLREEGLGILLGVDLDYYSQNSVGEVINRLNFEIGRTARTIKILVNLVISVITILFFLGLLISISWELTLISAVLLPGIVWINQYFILRAKKLGEKLSRLSRLYSIRVLETLSGIRLVKATGNEPKEFARIQKLIRSREEIDFQSQKGFAVIGPINEISGILALIGVIVISRWVFRAQLDLVFAGLMTYLLLLFRLLPHIGHLNRNRTQLVNTASSVDVVDDFLSKTNKPFMKRGSTPYRELKKEIRFNRVSFRYPGGNRWVLRDIELRIPKGGMVAVVGHSGAGKSTLADLLARFYDPYEGSVTLDGIDLRELDFKSLRRRMGIVSQETFLFNASFRENIAYARPDATETEILEAVKRANAHDFIANLPNGLDTEIGDRGVLLSGGERQRIAIARALLQDPDILILDEATSALDSESERLVQEAIDDLRLGRTTLIIAHRLSTIQKARLIVVLDHGHIIETGSHVDLIKRDGTYARLYADQFKENINDGIKASRYDDLIKTTYIVENRLRKMIGTLQLLMDGLDGNLGDRAELTREVYQTAKRSIEIMAELLDEAETEKHEGND